MLSIMDGLILLILLILAYVLGSISSAVLVCRAAGLPDPRTQGSGNPGATNVLRVGGKAWVFVVLLLDILKGLIPTLVASVLSEPCWAIGLVAFVAVVGHIFPLFFKLQGGRGVATAIGALIAISWNLAGAFILTWLIVAGLFRYSSLAALVAIALIPFYAKVFLSDAYVLPLLAISVLIIYRHRSNIIRLLGGQEPKLGKKTRS